jgi:putative PIN family toxin of toxin-antitoxin system
LICVFDSGVWISAFHFGGTPLAALNHAFEQHRIAVCEPILLEISVALTGKFGWTHAEVESILGEYLADAIHVNLSGNLNGICRDPKDDMVFECALLSGAKMIVSGDKDLLAVEIDEGIQVMTPREFLSKTQ